MRILVAPDKFKGTATAQAVCESIAIALNSDHDIAIQPLADGGEEQSKHLEEQIAVIWSQAL